MFWNYRLLANMGKWAAEIYFYSRILNDVCILESYRLRSLWSSCYGYYKCSVYWFNEYQFYGVGYKIMQIL